MRRRFCAIAWSGTDREPAAGFGRLLKHGAGRVGEAIAATGDDDDPPVAAAAEDQLAAGDALLSPSVTRRLIERYRTAPATPADRSVLHSLTVRERDAT